MGMSPCIECKRPTLPFENRKVLRAMAGDLSQWALDKAVPLAAPMCDTCAVNRIEAAIIREVHEAEQKGKRWGSRRKAAHVSGG